MKVKYPWDSKTFSASMFLSIPLTWLFWLFLAGGEQQKIYNIETKFIVGYKIPHFLYECPIADFLNFIWKNYNLRFCDGIEYANGVCNDACISIAQPSVLFFKLCFSLELKYFFHNFTQFLIQLCIHVKHLLFSMLLFGQFNIFCIEACTYIMILFDLKRLCKLQFLFCE